MLLHKNHKFIYNHAATIQLPNNVYLDPCPDPCPVEGLVLYSEDMRARAEIHFITTEKDPETFLKEGTECYDTFQCTKPIMTVRTNEIEGLTMSYTTKRYIYEEYVFPIPGEEATLLNLCIEQQRETPTNPDQYAQLITELLAGVQVID